MSGRSPDLTFWLFLAQIFEQFLVLTSERSLDLIFERFPDLIFEQFLVLT
jgi:hypothetical protein